MSQTPAKTPADTDTQAPLTDAEVKAQKELEKAQKKQAALDALYEDAVAEKGGLTLIPARKVEVNKTVEPVEPRVERNGMVVCRRK